MGGDISSIISMQKNEITEYLLYLKLSRRIEDKNNKKVLEHISKDELNHYNILKEITKKDVSSKRFKLFIFNILSFIFGLTFTLKLMEKGELVSQENYLELSKKFPSLRKIINDENKHEKDLLNLLKEEKLEYAGSIVLGLNDALVELTGALAGLTLALQNPKMIAVTGFITGIAAALSMAASGYLSSKEDRIRNPLRSALYTGLTYLITVLILIIPYLVLSNIYLSLIITLILAILIIATYTFFISISKDLKFWSRFLEMGMISLTIATISFCFGYILKLLFNL
jgi:VIT1/CCC1 family predicted Fe2+/Mn2+ transporter